MLSLLIISFVAAHTTGVLAAEYAPVVASTATAVSAMLAAVAAVSAWQTRRGKHSVDAIQVTQETMLSTIADLRRENEILRGRVDEAERQLRECQSKLNQIAPPRRRP